MALTGLPIKGVDAQKVGLVEAVLETPLDYDEHVRDVVYSQEPGTYDSRHMFWHKENDPNELTPWEEFIHNKS